MQCLDVYINQHVKRLARESQATEELAQLAVAPDAVPRFNKQSVIDRASAAFTGAMQGRGVAHVFKTLGMTNSVTGSDDDAFCTDLRPLSTYCTQPTLATVPPVVFITYLETNHDPVSEEEKSLGTNSESISDSDSNGDSDSTGESSSKSKPPPADEPSSSTPPAVKRVRAAVDGLDPDIPRVSEFWRGLRSTERRKQTSPWYRHTEQVLEKTPLAPLWLAQA